MKEKVISKPSVGYSILVGLLVGFCECVIILTIYLIKGEVMTYPYIKLGIVIFSIVFTILANTLWRKLVLFESEIIYTNVLGISKTLHLNSVGKARINLDNESFEIYNMDMKKFCDLDKGMTNVNELKKALLDKGVIVENKDAVADGLGFKTLYHSIEKRNAPLEENENIKRK